MAIYTISNNKGGSRKTATALNLIHHLELDFVIDLDKYHALKKIIALGDNNIEVRVPKTEQDILDWVDEGKNVLIDCGGFDSNFNQIALSQSDVIIAPSNDDVSEQFGLENFNDTMVHVSKMVNEKLTATVVISGVHHSRSDFSVMKEFVDSMSHLELSSVVIPHSNKIPSAQFQGKAVTSGTVAAKFSALAKSIKID